MSDLLRHDEIEIAYFDRFHVPMRHGLRTYLESIDPRDVKGIRLDDLVLCNGYFAPGPLRGYAVGLRRYFDREIGYYAVRDELREIGTAVAFPFGESTLRDPEECYVRLALNAAHQIAIDEERGRNASA